MPGAVRRPGPAAGGTQAPRHTLSWTAARAEAPTRREAPTVRRPPTPKASSACPAVGRWNARCRGSCGPAVPAVTTNDRTPLITWASITLLTRRLTRKPTRKSTRPTAAVPSPLPIAA